MSTTPSAPAAAPAATEAASPYSRKNPFPAKLVTNRRLSAEGSGKEIRHFEISLTGSGLSYEVGDAMGVYPQNCPELVQEILTVLGASGEEMVNGAAGSQVPLRYALSNDYIITQPSKEFIASLAAKIQGNSVIKDMLADPLRKDDLQKYLWGMELIDFLVMNPSIQFSPDELIGTLRKLQPRLYSISSSLKAHPDQVHLTIACVRYESHGRQRKGVASTFLADRCGHESAAVPIFFHTAKHFRLPEDPATPVIMVGPGTGIAPFRAYLQERKAIGGGGKNWLFFGDQRSNYDYLYRDELEAAQADGSLTRLDTAWSRDQDKKVYVQHKMNEHAEELWKWLEEGAHFFVCGDAARMAKDVDAALHQVVEKAGGRTPPQAAEYVEGMKKAKRYKRDVY
ncbi:MAG: sulfite reductase subunit alpha [Verrucomicrobia bacterium]|nr:sulfite reductase subunit alpha [Verrucomicrobiota bacterium]